MDRFSPAAAAHVRVLVLPVGRIERDRFVGFLARLQAEASIIQHNDLKPLAGDDDFVLSPTKFAQGCILFNYTSSSPAESTLQFSPYEFFREPLLVLGVAEGLGQDGRDKQQELKAAAEYLREKHSRVVHRQLFFLQDGAGEDEASEFAINVQSPCETGNAALHNAVNLLAVRFLRELTTYVQAMQASPSIPTPGQTSRSLQRMSWLRDADTKPGTGSGHGTPHDLGSPTSEDGPTRSQSNSRSSPATSFDQIAGASTAVSALARSDSNKGKNGRGSSQDRVSVQGFGTGTSQEKTKKRGKARVGIVVGSIYMMAGIWGESLQLLVEHTNQARSLNDYLWHAKGLENIVVCLMLQAWAGLDFQVPSICYPIAERNTSVPVAQRFSVSLPADFRPTGAANQASVRRLSASLPDLLKQILSLYRSNEGTIELHSQLICEATVRFSKLLAILHNANGLFDESSFAQIVQSKLNSTTSGSSESYVKQASVQGSRVLSKSAIAEIVISALPTPEDGISTPDHLAILGGVASVYAILLMHRKKAITIKDLVVRLTTALNQARKLGAAEMGIHPAASLSIEGGADGLVASIQESEGMLSMIVDLANIYGINLIGTVDSGGQTEGEGEDAKPPSRATDFGGEALKYATVRELLALCEASPDPYGILRLIVSFLNTAGPKSAIDGEPSDNGVALAQDEQARLATLMSRTIGVSRQLGLPNVQADYWDPFMLRAITFVSPPLNMALLDRSKLRARAATLSQQTPSNPLLYDPNASQQVTAQQTTTLVQGERTECILTLQNPWDVALDIESITLITEGAELTTDHEGAHLGASRLQQVKLIATPTSPGKTEIKACRIKISGCREQVFQIASKPWTARKSLSVKNIGQDARLDDDDSRFVTADPEYSTVLADVISPLPSLVLESTSLLESSLMLLEGEKRSFEVTIRNLSDVEATVMEVIDSNNCLHTASETRMTVPAHNIASLTLEVLGKAGPSELRADIFYASSTGSDKYARIVSIPITSTVNTTLRAENLEITESSSETDTVRIALDLVNTWPRAVSFDCRVRDFEPWETKEKGVLPTEETLRVYLNVRRWHSNSNTAYAAEDLKSQLFARVRVQWKVDNCTGLVPLNSLTLPPSAPAILRAQPISIALSTPAASEAKINAFTVIRATVHNGSLATGQLYVQLYPRVPGMADESRMAVAGTLSRLMPALAAGESGSIEFAICPLLSGRIEISATARPVVVSKAEEEGFGRARSRAIMLRVR